ncbi:hypothetical protein SEPCBS119000_005408 [Sporothrix epigloea]|uniref:Uncharacterized protein n=1 Tax=Sporothrix epigloea TaxID=1892477 RepID=A0ABP0DXS1_9PEZI
MIQETPVHPPSIPMSAFTFQSAAPLSKESAISVQSMQSQPLTTQQQQQQRAWSPPRPPLSPILPAAELPPHLAPTTTGSGTFYTPNFVSGRAIFTHTEAARAAAAQRASAAVAAAAASAAIESVAGDPHLADSHVATSLPPAPLPIDFASNTDVLALQSTISILQLQKKKATADIRALQQAKVAALAQPEAFLRQLQDIQQGTQQGRQTAVDDSDNGSSSDSDVDAGDEINGGSTKIKEADVDLPTEDPVPTPGRSFATAKGRLQHQQQSPLSQTSSSEAAPGVPDLRKLPQPQNIVRMPPINWNKYAVVGEGLEKLHADQIRRPPVGAPAAATLFMENGQSNQALYKFQGGLENAAAAADTAPGAPEYQGIASPYDPLKDVLDPAGTAAALVPTAAVFATSANGVDATTSSAVPSTVTASIRRRSQSSATRR